MALVFDRILLIIFTIVSLTGTITILAQRTQNSYAMIDLNNLDEGISDACNYTYDY